MYQEYINHLSKLNITGKYRKLPELNDAGSKLLDFSSNDYLFLSKNESVINAGIAAAKECGAGATGSRLLSGNSAIFEELEKKIAKSKKEEAALVFNSGFQANFSVLAALLDSKVLGAKPIVFFDRLNHASLYQAIFLAAPELIRYVHNDMSDLAELLDKYENDARPKFIVAETVFGMDGDLLPVAVIADLARKHNAFLYLDEAHATGIFGPDGYGLSATADLSDLPHLVMGTFSKALGCSGGYIACAQVLKNYIINTASGFIYSTANTPANAASASKAWDLIKDMEDERKSLLLLSEKLRGMLKANGFNIGASQTHIIPVILGPEENAMKAKRLLLEHKILVSAIRPPTVPPGSSRIRIALTLRHTQSDIEKLIEVLGLL